MTNLDGKNPEEMSAARICLILKGVLDEIDHCSSPGTECRDARIIGDLKRVINVILRKEEKKVIFGMDVGVGEDQERTVLYRNTKVACVVPMPPPQVKNSADFNLGYIHGWINRDRLEVD